MKWISADRAAGVAVFLASLTIASAGGPTFQPSGPNAAAYGEAQHFPVGDRDTWTKQPFLVGSYSRYDTLFHTNRVARAAVPWNFRRAEKEPEIHYEFGGKTHMLSEYLAHFPVTGILLLQGDTILLERYQYSRTDSDRFMSASMAKSIMSMLVGIAIEEKLIRSLDDEAQRYVPALKDTAYGRTPLRALLNMSSGIEFEHRLPGVEGSPGSQHIIDGMLDPKIDMIALLAAHQKHAFPPGTHYDYSGGDNETTGFALRAATGKSLSDYLSEKIWQPIGTEADATWWADPKGQEFPASGFNATLRDYARLGRLLAYDGNWNGRQLVPKAFLLEATTTQPAYPHLAPGGPTPYYGYSFQFWIFPGTRRMFVLRGANSQYVFVDPLSKLVLVQTGVYSEGPDSVNGKSESMAVWLAMVRQFGGEARN